MLIDTEAFMLAAVGGVLIGLSATLLMWLNGRILGVSGLVGGLLALSSDDRAMRFAFLAGVVVTGLAGAAMLPASNPGPNTSNVLLLLAGGFAVGLGTRLGSTYSTVENDFAPGDVLKLDKKWVNGSCKVSLKQKSM